MAAELKITLEALHRCESEVEELARETGQLPADIEASEARASAARQAIEAEHARLEQGEQTRRHKEADLADCEAQRAKYQGQTALVKTNTEYTALLAEIDTTTARISGLEEDILAAMELVEEIQSGLKSFERDKQSQEQQATTEAEAGRKRLGELLASLEDRRKERAQLAEQLPGRAASTYQRIQRGRGTGTAVIGSLGCSGCHRDVPYETINRVNAGELHSCGNCGRILVVMDP